MPWGVPGTPKGRGSGEDGARKLGIPEQPMLGWLLLALAALARGGECCCGVRR